MPWNFIKAKLKSERKESKISIYGMVEKTFQLGYGQKAPLQLLPNSQENLKNLFAKPIFQGNFHDMKREREIQMLRESLEKYPVVGIIGARQVGKTTLARMLAGQYESPATFFDLENPDALARLAEPMLALKHIEGLVVIDEIQRQPDLYPVLRVLADRPGLPARFLILGSASPELLRQTSESLAGRIQYHHLEGFAIDEAGVENYQRLWLRGGLPRSYLADTETDSFTWRREYVQTFLERDLPMLGINVNATTMRRFWTMLAHWHGQVWNASEFARSFGVADTTVRNHLDRLTSALVVRQLFPWHANIAKRQVRSPKVYIADSGILHALLNQPEFADMEAHPKLGASWEGFALNQVRLRLGAHPDECYFWATHAGAELDLLVVRGRHRLGFEFKRSSAPRVTRSARTALADLELDRLDIVHAGEHTFPLDKKIRAVSIERLWQDLPPLSEA